MQWNAPVVNYHNCCLLSGRNPLTMFNCGICRRSNQDTLLQDIFGWKKSEQWVTKYIDEFLLHERTCIFHGSIVLFCLSSQAWQHCQLCYPPIDLYTDSSIEEGWRFLVPPAATSCLMLPGVSCCCECQMIPGISCCCDLWAVRRSLLFRSVIGYVISRFLLWVIRCSLGVFYCC